MWGFHCILLHIITLLMLVYYGEVIINAPLSQIVKLQNETKLRNYKTVSLSLLKFLDIVKLNTLYAFLKLFPP